MWTGRRLRFRKLSGVVGVVGLGLSLLTGGVAAAPEGLPSGAYTTLANPQPADAGKSVEVVEFFGYYSPRSYAMDVALTDWVKKEGSKVRLKRVPVVFSPLMEPQAQTYVALELMGKADALHTKIFQAIHVQRKRLVTDSDLLDFVVQNGVDKARFQTSYGSFALQTRMKTNAKRMAVEDIDEVPTFTLDGRYQTSQSRVDGAYGLQNQPASAAVEATIRVLDQLVDKVLAERDAAKPKKQAKQ